MSNFNTFERAVSKFLSSSPKVKSVIKRTYQHLSYTISKKYPPVSSAYSVSEVALSDKKDVESFFGYYDNSPHNSGLNLYQLTDIATKYEPTYAIKKGFEHINVVVSNDESIVFRAKTRAFNWQQGTKLQWVDDKKFVYNDIGEGEKIFSNVVDLNDNSIRKLSNPVYDCFKNEFFLSLDFKILSKLRPDYGYFVKNGFTDIDFNDQKIVKSDFNDNFETVLTLSELLDKFPIDSSVANENQKFNHIMISPNGTKFIFLHRYYNNEGRRYDRFFLYDFIEENLHLLSDSGMISHFSWYEDDKIISYMNNNGVNGYYVIRLTSPGYHVIHRINIPELDKYGDGHPTYIGNDKFITDTYPNKSRMKSLLLIDLSSNKCTVIASFYEPLCYFGQTRCDLHPKWSAVDCSIYVDSVHDGKRRLYKVGPINV